MEQDFTEDEELLVRMGKFADKTKRYMRAFFGPFLEEKGLRPHHVSFMACIHRYEGLSQKDIRNYIPYDKSRISTVVHELQAMGIVENRASGRNTSLALTPLGQSEYETFVKMMREFRENLLAGTDSNDLEAYYRCIAVFEKNMDELLGTEDPGDLPL